MPTGTSADQQLMLELINRFRADPGAEAALLTGANAQSDVHNAIDYFGVSLAALQNQLSALSSAAPLAWNDDLAASAAGHNQAMIAADQQTHQAPGEPGLGQRAINAGYANYSYLGENVYAFADDVVDAHAGFVIDWGYDSGDYDGSTLRSDFQTRGDGMQDPPGHRENLIDPGFTEAGIALTAENDNSTQVGPLVVTEDLGVRDDYQPQFVGVVINDLDHDHFYDVGEGLGGVTVTLRSGASTYSTTSWASGGWQIAVPDGAYAITFSGGSLAAPITENATLGSVNVKVDADVENGNARRATFSDFNGDGLSDILWRNDNGALSDWLGAAGGGFTVNDGAALTQVPTSWHVAGTGDFNGDGLSDVVWRNDNGTLSDWLGKAGGGFTVNDAAAQTRVSTDWHVAGTGDFNGDGRADILWRNDNGTLSDWLGTASGGFTPNDGAALTKVSTDWHVAGTGDFDGDGRGDILWRNDNGTLSDWLGKASGGFAANDAAALTKVSTDWHVAGTGDFNGDGRGDILWRNDNGTLSDWLGKAGGGFTPNDGAALTQVPTSWHVAGTGDFDGDGRGDILWRNDSGALSDWLGRPDGGFTQNDAAAYTNVAAAWRVQPSI